MPRRRSRWWSRDKHSGFGSAEAEAWALRGEKPEWLTSIEPNLEQVHEDQLVIRDILYLYRETTDYTGISGDHTTGAFDPWRYLACEADDEWRDHDDALLLRQGSAVALLSDLLDTWDAGGPDESWRSALEAGRFDHLPEARRAVAAGLETEAAMYPHLAVVYDEYVLAYFEMLAREGRPDPRHSVLKPPKPRTSFRDPR
jgi:hypothetical protein